MARRGRPRKPESVPRATTREGRESHVEPTPELLAHRRRITGDATVATDFPLDVLAAWYRRDAAAGVPVSRRRGIDAEAWRAGWRFARLGWRAFRPPVPLPPLFWSMRVDSVRSSAPLDDAALEEDAARVRQEWRAARTALALGGRSAVRSVDAVVVALAMPADPAGMAALRRGLVLLDRHFFGVGAAVSATETALRRGV